VAAPRHPLPRVQRVSHRPRTSAGPGHPSRCITAVGDGSDWVLSFPSINSLLGSPTRDRRRQGTRKETTMPARPRRITTFLVAIALLAITPLAVIAADKFDDVPDSNIFHDDIAWLADADVTRGCNPPDNTQFCPSDNVTREQ